jgi:homospermidine synthase
MKSLLILVIIAVAAALTNPSKQEHLQAISDKNALVGGLVELGSALGGVSYNNYIVASTLSINGKNLTVGVFKNIVVVLKDQSSK